MDRDELEVLKYHAMGGGQEAIEKAFLHIWQLRDLVGNLAEGLEYPELQKEVDRLLNRESDPKTY